MTAKQKTDRQKGKRGMTPFEPTDVHRQTVELLQGLGLTLDEIAACIENPRTKRSISKITLQKHFKKELAEGHAKLKAQVLNSLARKAISDDHPQAATCAIFMAKCRYGFVSAERRIHEVETKTGVMVAPASRTTEEWIAEERAKNGKKAKARG